MTQDDIIRFAIQCHLVTTGNRDGLYMDSLIEFANLVAAKEREACAKVCDDIESRCIAEDVDDPPLNYVAYAIRARGEQALAQLKQDGDCKKCKDGCPACDARKLQKEAHDLL